MKGRLRPSFLALVIGGGPALGMLGHRGLDREEGRDADRIGAALALFQRHCVPFTGGDIVAPSSSLERCNLTGSLMFLDPDSRFVLSLSATHCAVSDIVDPIDPRDWPSLKQGVYEMIERELPVLTFQGNRGAGPQRDRALWREEPLMEAPVWGAACPMIRRTSGRGLWRCGCLCRTPPHAGKRSTGWPEFPSIT